MNPENRVIDDAIRIPDDCDLVLSDNREIVRAVALKEVLEKIRPRLEGVLFEFRNFDISDTSEGSGRSIISTKIDIAGLDPTEPFDMKTANEIIRRFNEKENSDYPTQCSFAITYEPPLGESITVPCRFIYQPAGSRYRHILKVPEVEGVEPSIIRGQKDGGFNATLHSFKIEQKQLGSPEK